MVQAVLATDTLRMVGLASHYPAAADAIGSEEQEQRWHQVVAGVADLLPTDCWCHLANSEGLIHRPAIGDAVRVGLLLTGVEVSESKLGLKQAMTWHSEISLVKDLPAGHGVSYNSQFRMPEDGRIALVPVGYADGYPIRASNQARLVLLVTGADSWPGDDGLFDGRSQSGTRCGGRPTSIVQCCSRLC